MEDAHKSIPIVTCHIASAIKGRLEDDDFLHAIEAVEEFAEKNSLDQRAQKTFSLLLFCAHKVYILQTNKAILYLLTNTSIFVA